MIGPWDLQQEICDGQFNIRFKWIGKQSVSVKAI